MSNFHKALHAKFSELECKGTFVPTTHISRFPKIGQQLFEPEEKSWHSSKPLFTHDSSLYHINVLANLKPLSAFDDISESDKELAMIEITFNIKTAVLSNAIDNQKAEDKPPAKDSQNDPAHDAVLSVD